MSFALSSRGVWLAALLLFVSVCSGFWLLSAWRNRGQTLEAARARLGGLVALLDRHAEYAIESGDEIVREGIALARGWDPDDEDAGRTIHDRLRGLAERRRAGRPVRLIFDSSLLTARW